MSRTEWEGSKLVGAVTWTCVSLHTETHLQGRAWTRNEISDSAQDWNDHHSVFTLLHGTLGCVWCGDFQQIVFSSVLPYDRVSASWHFFLSLLPLFQEIHHASYMNLWEELGCCGGYAYRQSSVPHNTLWFCAFSPATLPLPTWVPSVLIPVTLL